MSVFCKADKRELEKLKRRIKDLENMNLGLATENHDLKSLLSELFKNRKNNDWCFEMSSTIEDATNQ